jgi:uncharacterized membrane protein
MGDALNSPRVPAQAVAAVADFICPECGSSMPASAAYCPGCGRAMGHFSPAERWAAAAAYCTLIPAIVLLYLPRFRGSRFVRFHAWQSIFLWGVFLAASTIAVVLSNFAAAIILLLLGILASLAMFFLWIVLSVKAWLGEQLELPLFGPWAARMR